MRRLAGLFIALGIVATALWAVGAYATSESLLDIISSVRPQWFQPGIYIGSAVSNPPQSILNKLTGFVSCSETVDFTGSTTTQSTSSGCTASGARVGDACFVGWSTAGLATADAGVLQGVVQCKVTAANTVKFFYVPNGTFSEPVSAAYNAFVFSNQ